MRDETGDELTAAANEDRERPRVHLELPCREGRAMSDTREQILNQLRAGEDSRTEFKEVRLGDRGRPRRDLPQHRGCRRGTGRAHERRGRRPVPRHRRHGRRPRDSAGTRRYGRALIVNVATHHCEPLIRPILRKMLLPRPAGDEQRILLAEVPRGLYVHRTSDERYTRIGSTKRGLMPRSLSGSSSRGAASTSSMSNPSSPHPWTP